MVLAKAIQVMMSATEGEWDKSGIPSMMHPLRVMVGVQKALPHLDELQAAAVLHDMQEDYPEVWEQARGRFPPYVVESVDAVSRKLDETYEEFIERVRVHPSKAALLTKIADLEDNLSRPGPESLKKKNFGKYTKALEVLNNELVKRAASLV